MDFRKTQEKPFGVKVTRAEMARIEAREWWLMGFAVTVTLILTFGIASFTFPGFHLAGGTEWLDLKDWIRGLAALVLLFDIYTPYQHLHLQRTRRRLVERDELFQLISENAADMIAVVDQNGHRVYNSPAYQKVLGYSSDELNATSSIEQIHIDDRPQVLKAARNARLTGQGETLEYRMRHKDGSWRILESTASAIRNAKGETENLVIVNRDITERKRAEDLLAHNASHDSLTNLPNRALFLHRLGHALALARRHADYKFAVLIIDVDEFKVFNDSLGHSAGDELLIQIGKRLSISVRELDSIARPRVLGKPDASSSDESLARLGGDEFSVLLDDIRDASDAIRVASRIREKWTTPFTINGQEIVITVSVGITFGTAAYTEPENLLRDAEIAMYRAKAAGKGRCELFDPAMHASAVKRLKLETDLRKALELGEFRVFYQPIVSLENQEIIGFEALTRWQRPEGMISPADFIPVANETGLILPMNRMLMKEAFKQLHMWRSEFPSSPPRTMSVNITAKQFEQPELAAEIGLLIQQSGLDPSSVQLEITETISMGDSERALQVFSELKALGVRLSIDDFGTGYSSLSRLQGFPVDSLKIDRAFISSMDSDAESFEIVRLIVMLAHTLGLKIVAEGTETIKQVNKVKQLGCEMAQGYYFSRPVDQTAISNLLKTSKSKFAAAGAN
ncbi:MAG: EAL domain-containing protein [Terriglobales bacterium]